MKKILTALAGLAIGAFGFSASASSVSFYFQDGEEDDFELYEPWTLVNIWNETAETSVVPTGAFMEYNYDGVTMLRISPDDFDYELAISVDEYTDLENYTLFKEDTEWFLTLFGDTDGMEVYVRVYLAGQAPSTGDEISAVSTTFNIVAEGEIDNPGRFVTISYFDRATFTDTTVGITDGFGEATVGAGTSITIAPAEGYKITDVFSFAAGVADISEPSSPEDPWYVYIIDSPKTDFASFFVTVAKADTGGSGDEFDTEAVIARIEPLQWTVTWDTYLWVNKGYCIYDAENPLYRAFLTGPDDKKTYLYCDEQIIFPEYGNYFTVNLEGLGLPKGEYELTVPEGYVSLVPGNEPNVTQYLSLTIGDGFEAEHPVHFTEVDGNTFDIYWEGVTSLAPADTNGAYMENLTTGEKYELYYLVDDLYSQANLRIVNNFLRVNLTNNYPTLPGGRYSLYLPAGYVSFNGSQTVNDAIEGHEFSYDAPWTEGIVAINGPFEDGTITLEWEQAISVSPNIFYEGDGANIHGVCVFDGQSEQVDVPMDHLQFNENVMTVSLTGLTIQPGQCQLLVPEGFLYVNVDGEIDYNEGTTYRFTYGSADEPDPAAKFYQGEASWNVGEGDVVKKGEYVEVSWDGHKLTAVENPDDEVSVYGSISAGYVELKYGPDVLISEDGTRLLISLASLPSEIYRINVPEAYLYIEADGQQLLNISTSVDFVIADNEDSAVDGVAADGGRCVVFDLNGVKVLEADNADGLRSLPKGVYIVNGKKWAK